VKTEYKYTLTCEDVARAVGNWCKHNPMPDGQYQVSTFWLYTDGVLNGAEVIFTPIDDNGATE